jgi:hypothetical protein
MSNIMLKKNLVKEGFKLYESRLKCESLKECFSPIKILKCWNGKVKCTNLLVLFEQGIGDRFQFYPYLFILKERYSDLNITILIAPNLSHLFNNNNQITIINSTSDLSKFDYKLNILSIPYILEIEEIKPLNLNIDYINIEPKLDKKWQSKLKDITIPIIGIYWKGNNVTYIDKFIPINKFNKILDLNIYPISLQKNSKLLLKNENYNKNLNIFDIDQNVSFQDTAAILKNIDLLITVDSSIVHLAGLMNVNTWLLLGDNIHAEWRWFDDSISKWYHSIKIYRGLSKDTDNLMNIVYNDLKLYFKL